ncbi:MAG: TonB family protein [Bacteroidaceae bacterium]|nr:TonB family protein [Bacteroidaceae bacterium]
MKNRLLLAGAMLWCGCIAAATLETTPQDSTRTKKMEIKMMDGKNTGLIEKQNRKAVSIKEMMKIDKSNPKDIGAPEIENPKQTESKNSAEEMKNMAKREGNKPTIKNIKPKVSYPTYPGGNVAIREFVRKNQQYPKECKRERLRGRVEVIIAIAPDGTPHSATISKSSDNVYMDAEALRIAELMPRWTPAEESEDPQGTECVIFVNFRPGR